MDHLEWVLPCEDEVNEGKHYAPMDDQPCEDSGGVEPNPLYEYDKTFHFEELASDDGSNANGRVPEVIEGEQGEGARQRKGRRVKGREEG